MTDALWTVLRSGGEYTIDHVASLAMQLSHVAPDMQLHVLTDLDTAKPIKVTKRFQGRNPICWIRPDADTLWPGWWMKMNLFHPQMEAFGPRTLYCDLDTVLVGDISPLREVKHPTVLMDFYRKGLGIGSGLMMITPQVRATIWSGWMSGKPERWMAELSPRGLGDQVVLEECEKYHKRTFFQRWQDILPGQILSYKADMVQRGMYAPPFGARVICFHGKPRPWELSAAWIRQAEDGTLPKGGLQ